MLLNYLNLLSEIGWTDLLDIGVTTLILALGVHVLRSARARAVTAGLFVFAIIYLSARHFELQLTTWLLQGIAAAMVILLIVVFQNEIRRFLEQFPARLVFRGGQKQPMPEGIAHLLADAVGQLSTAGYGALIILPGLDPLPGHVSGGTKLDGQLSKALILSIFDPNSPGHDGALIVHGDRATFFGVRLPLSDQHEKLRDRGTRHAAALGLSERTDAFVIVVSEETSRISVAQHGELLSLAGADQLFMKIDQFLHRDATLFSTNKSTPALLRWCSKNLLIALPCALALWLFLVPASVIDNVTIQVPINVQNIPDGFQLSRVVPTEVAVTLTGKRRDLFLVNPRDLEIPLDGTLTRFGRKTFPITKGHLLLPPDVEILTISPEDVQVFVSGRKPVAN